MTDTATEVGDLATSIRRAAIDIALALRIAADAESLILEARKIEAYLKGVN